ncbi:hypothetical protein CXP35_10790 [Komagataeibacter xylinus]|nr:hypothetical protein CXP35_10790 [Komagataeibacter xylinus]
MAVDGLAGVLPCCGAAGVGVPPPVCMAGAAPPGGACGGVGLAGGVVVGAGGMLPLPESGSGVGTE